MTPAVIAGASASSLLWLADYTYTDASWNDAQRTYLISRAASNTLSLNVTYTEPQGRWTLMAGGSNLTEDRTSQPAIKTSHWVRSLGPTTHRAKLSFASA